MTEYKTSRATISDSELVEWIEETTRQGDASEQELVN